MKKLILNPNKIDKKSVNVFLGKWFLFLIKKKKLKNIKFDLIPEKKTNAKNYLLREKYYDKIYNIILNEIYPKLNNINNINWKRKTWNFLIGFWLYAYIVVIIDRINLLKPVLKKKSININYLFEQKNVLLVNNDLRHFTFNAGLINWNEKIFIKILYLLKTKKFKNELNFLTLYKHFLVKKKYFLQNLIYRIKILVLKFFERILCFNNKIILTNTYIKSKFKFFKIWINLKSVPFIYSFNFFNNKITYSNFNYELRNKLKINFNTKDINLKICKFLLPELFPTIYLEGFKNQFRLSHSSHLPKSIKKIFTTSFYEDNVFKFWVAGQINDNAQLYTGQHGAGYNIYKNWRFDKFENSISKKRFLWGAHKNSKKQITVGNFLINNNKILNDKIIDSQKYLMLLPTFEFFQRGNSFDARYDSSECLFETQKIIDYLDTNLIKISVKGHPTDRRRISSFGSFLKFNRSFKSVNSKASLNKLYDEHALIIFPYLSTEFFKLMALNKPCMLLLNKIIFSKFLNKRSRKDFEKLRNSGILHLSGRSLANKLNKILNNLANWWGEKKVNRAKYIFCKNYSNPIFNEEIIVKNLK